ncbi:MAG: urease accessory protein UreE [Magnetococcales bacterium]|nr:urease accessory protein UreE [Magnetococcales bacterium]
MRLRAFADLDSRPVHGLLPLTWTQRCHSRLQAHLPDGTAVTIALPHGTQLRHGDRLQDDDGRVIGIEAAPEPLLRVIALSPLALTRAAYHLGNRHAMIQLQGEGLLLPEDPILEAMLAGLGCLVTRVRLPFEPERGAYAHAHPVDHGRDAAHEHDHDHGHDHGPRIHAFA